MTSPAKLLWAAAVCLWVPMLACSDDVTPADPAETETGEDPETSGDGDGDGDGDGNGDGDGDGDGETPDPLPSCSDTSCSTSCTVESTMEDGFGGTCTCSNAAEWEDYVECELPILCADDDHLCRMQALRYGVYGQIHWQSYFSGEDHETYTVQMFGDGTARATTHTQTHSCCGGGSVETEEIHHHASGVISSGGSYWNDCATEIINISDPWVESPNCLEVWSWSTTCTGPVTLCPTPPELDDTCEASCPMAGDGICDEAQGTGLCDTGCDPIDCTCDSDQPDVCDEPVNGGACPIGSDPDC